MRGKRDEGKDRDELKRVESEKMDEEDEWGKGPGN